MKLKHRINIAIFYILRVFPIKSNKVVFSNFGGRGYGDNCKYIANSLLKKDPEGKLDIVWLCESNVQDLPTEIRAVPVNSFKAFFELATAKVWVDNIRKDIFVRKRKEQYYIMTWHAGIGIKKCEKDIESTLRKSYIKAAKNDSEMADLFLADSEWQYKVYRDSFWYENEIAKCGLPRMDIIFQDDEDTKNEIRNKIGLDCNTRYVLYAPTFRDNSDDDNISCCTLDWDTLIATLEKKTNQKWKGLVRLHPNVAHLSSKFNFSEDVTDVTSYPDMQELLLVSDCLITDYSSCIFDFAVTGKMAFIYATDLDSFILNRSLHFELSKLPFPISQSEDSLLNNIEKFSFGEYTPKLSYFYKNLCGLYIGGQASDFVADIIISKTV